MISVFACVIDDDDIVCLEEFDRTFGMCIDCPAQTESDMQTHITRRAVATAAVACVCWWVYMGVCALGSHSGGSTTNGYCMPLPRPSHHRVGVSLHVFFAAVLLVATVF
jgi:hypothetical protein